MVETTIALIFVLIVFLALFNLADLTRTKLLVENAAVKCARARAVGYNDFMLRKIARLATMPAAGRCLTPSDDGAGTLSRSDRYRRIGDYLMSEYEEQADAILDFGLFDFGVLTGAVNPDADSRATISASSTQEAHYPDYLQ